MSPKWYYFVVCRFIGSVGSPINWATTNSFFQYFLLNLFLIFNLILPVFSDDRITLDSLIKQARENNPEIIAAREKWQAAKARIWPEKTWENPEFFADYRRMPKENFSFNRADEKEYGVTQMVPFPGKLALKGKIAQSEAEKSEQEYRQTELNILSQLKVTYAMYFYITKSMETFKGTSEIMKIFAKVAESKYVSGTTSQSDVLRAQVETAKMLAMLTMAEQEKGTAQAELNALIGKSADEKLGAPTEELPKFIKKSWEEVKNIAVINSPMIKQQKADVSGKLWAKRLAWADFLPDFGLTYRQRKMTNEMDTQDLMIGFTLPLWVWRQGLGVKHKSRELKMAEAEKKNIELMTIAQAREFFVKLETSQNLIKLYNTGILPQAEQSLKVSEAMYQSGRGEFLELLDSVRTLLEFKLEYYKYISDYYSNLTNLEKVAGVEMGNE